MDQNNKDIIDSVVINNSLTENIQAKTMLVGMSNNEISNLSHALLCLCDEDFEQYVLAIRTLRATSKAFDLASKTFGPDYIKSHNEINVDNMPNLSSVPEKKIRLNQLKPLNNTAKKKDQTYLYLYNYFVKQNNSGYWKDICKNMFIHIYGPIEGKEEYFDKFLESIGGVTNQMKFIRKNYGNWSLNEKFKENVL